MKFDVCGIQERGQNGITYEIQRFSASAYYNTSGGIGFHTLFDNIIGNWLHPHAVSTVRIRKGTP